MKISDIRFVRWNFQDNTRCATVNQVIAKQKRLATRFEPTKERSEERLLEDFIADNEAIAESAITGASLRKLYRTPFRYDGRSYIFDADNNMVADFGGDGGTFRPRGYGRFHHMNRGADIHDCMEAMLFELTQNCPLYHGGDINRQSYVEALNQAWEEE